MSQSYQEEYQEEGTREVQKIPRAEIGTGKDVGNKGINGTRDNGNRPIRGVTSKLGEWLQQIPEQHLRSLSRRAQSQDQLRYCTGPPLIEEPYLKETSQ